MKVAELISLLQKQDPTDDVVIDTGDGEHDITEIVLVDEKRPDRIFGTGLFHFRWVKITS